MSACSATLTLPAVGDPPKRTFRFQRPGDAAPKTVTMAKDVDETIRENAEKKRVMAVEVKQRAPTAAASTMAKDVDETIRANAEKKRVMAVERKRKQTLARMKENERLEREARMTVEDKRKIIAEEIAGASALKPEMRAITFEDVCKKAVVIRVVHTKEQAKALPQYPCIDIGDISVPATAEAVAGAKAAIMRERVIGFDTETRPTFTRGTRRQPAVDVVQFATATHAWVFHLAVPGAREAAAEIAGSTEITKVGFDLRNDSKAIAIRNVIDLKKPARGIIYAFAALFGKSFPKSKKITLSNWSRFPLERNQVLYAARDAWGAMVVFNSIITQFPELQALIPRHWR